MMVRIVAFFLACILALGCSKSGPNNIDYSYSIKAGGDSPPASAQVNIIAGLNHDHAANESVFGGDINVNSFGCIPLWDIRHATDFSWPYIGVDVFKSGYPRGSWAENHSDNELSQSLASALWDETFRAYLGMPYYYFQSHLRINVFYIKRTTSGDWFSNLDLAKESKHLNGPTPIPELNPKYYFCEQSYGKFIPDFVVHNEILTVASETYSWNVMYPLSPERCAEMYEIVENENNKLLGPFVNPFMVILDSRDGDGQGFFNYEMYRRNEPPYPDYAIAYIGQALQDYIRTKMIASASTPASFNVQFYAHEIGHMLNWPDTYVRASDSKDSGLYGADVMAGGFAPLGIHKIASGWCPFVNVKYNLSASVIKPQDVYEGSRELYFLKQKGNNPGEFYYMELQTGSGVSPNLPYNSENVIGGSVNGLIAVHVHFDHPQNADGNGTRIRPFEIPSLFFHEPGSGTSPFRGSFPYVGANYDETSPIVPTWHSGERADFALRNIRFLKNRRYRTHLIRPEDDPDSAVQAYGYGDIICDVDVGSPLLGDVNGDGIVNEGDAAMLRLNMGRRVGIDALAVPVDVNGDGFLKLVYDRDEDGFIATSERIYDTAWNLVHTSGDWLDINGDGKNDLDAAGTGQFDAIERWYEEFRRLNREQPPMGGISTRNPPVPWHEMSPGLFEVSARSTGQGLPLASRPIAAWLIDQNEDGIIDFFDAEGDGKATLVPARLDADGDGVITEADAAYMGYYWGETTFEELWIPLPAPSWANY